MCGIAGIYSFDRHRAVESTLVEAMTQTLVHRGPDGVGFHVEGGVGLGFRRLAIVDPRLAGNQPHYSENRDVVSVCNGEIYNHRELRADLEARGHRMQSHCDVEILPHLCEEHGDALLGRLNGQFALALYEPLKHRLLLARDRVGVCPLFWCEVDGQILFASEVKGLLAHPKVPRRVDMAGLDQIITLPGLVSPRTVFTGIQSLPPGCALVIENGQVRMQRYWDLSYPRQAATTPAADWEEQLEHLLLQAVSRRLQADVPVGFYLSGGLDSSLMAGLIHRLMPHRDWQAFAIVFDDAAMDEGRYQRQMAEHIGVRLQQTRFSADMIEQRLRAVVRCAETPLRESYDTCSHVLSQAVQQANCKVVLSGEGADELFAGYVGYRFDMVRQQAGGGGLDDLLDGEDWEEMQTRETLWGDGQFFYERDYAAFRETRAALYAPDLAASFGQFDCTRKSLIDTAQIAGRHPFHQRSYVDFKLRIADHLLADHGDRMTFAHSVEGRYPFLDDDLIAFVTQLPPGLLMQDGREKYPLRQVARRYVHPSILAREKFSFVAPSSPSLLALAQGGSAEWIADLLAPERIRSEGIFNADTVAQLRATYLRPDFNLNQTFDADLMMMVLTFQLFREEFQLLGPT
jgi:asparagine synthase (glutamine-hydrolysing)